jgi:hypothetical protein
MAEHCPAIDGCLCKSSFGEHIGSDRDEDGIEIDDLDFFVIQIMHLFVKHGSSNPMD